MNEFQKYPSIDNLSNKLINVIESTPLFVETEWVVSEKVHGCNLLMMTDGTDVTFGSRNRFLETTKDFRLFYNVDKHLSNYIPIIKQMHHDLDIIGVLTIYGELFGGGYNDVKRLIQKEVLYCNQIEFYAFDIKINDAFLHHFQKTALFDKYGFIYAQDLFRGSFHECIHYSKTTRDKGSTIPTLLHLPFIENNIREGNVIRPVEFLRFLSGSPVIIKDKNDKFCERKRDDKKDDQKEYDVCIPYITEQRLHNVLSKMGDVDVLCENKSNIPIIMRRFVKDVMEDIAKDTEHIKSEDINGINEKDLVRVVSRYSLPMVKELFIVK